MRIYINFDAKLTGVPALTQGDKQHLTILGQMKGED